MCDSTAVCRFVCCYSSGTDRTGERVTQQDTDPQRQHSNEQDGGSLPKSSERREATDIRDRSVGPAVAAIGTRGISGLFGVLTDESRQFAWSPTPLTERPLIR